MLEEELKLGMKLELEDSFHIHHYRNLKDRMRVMGQKQCQQCKFHQFYVVHLGILKEMGFQGLELVKECKQWVLMVHMVMVMGLIRNSSIRSSCHLRMQPKLLPMP
jgi:hypothetical protein